jgi:hypothetical protein
VQNKGHTWRRVVDGQARTGLSGPVALEGFQPGATFDVEWHLFTTRGAPSLETSEAVSDADGRVTLWLPDDPEISDLALKLALQE